MYFINFPETLYKFGNESTFTGFENISAYVDIIDSVKDNSSFYRKYNILEGDRPEVLSQKLYGTTAYYWTFYLMNDHIRRNGWPLSYNNLLEKAQKDYPNVTIVTRDLFFDTFKVGDTVTGAGSAATGTVIKRNVDLGQIVVKSTNSKSFQASEVISDGTNTVTTNSVSDEYLSAHHYEDANGYAVDIDPENGPGNLLTEITILDRYVEANDALKEINFIREDNISQIVRAFENAMSGL